MMIRAPLKTCDNANAARAVDISSLLSAKDTQQSFTGASYR